MTATLEMNSERARELLRPLIHRQATGLSEHWRMRLIEALEYVVKHEADVAAAVQAEREAMRPVLYRAIVDSGVGMYSERSVIAETVDAAIRARK